MFKQLFFFSFLLTLLILSHDCIAQKIKKQVAKRQTQQDIDSSIAKTLREFRELFYQDSIKNIGKRKADSIRYAKQWELDSIKAAKKWERDSIKAAKKWERDSINYAKQDSIQAIKDSIKWEVERKKTNEITQQYLYPKDSLKYIDDKVAKLVPSDYNNNVDSAIAIINKNFSSALQKARAIFYIVSSRISYDYGAFANFAVLPIFDKDSSATYTFKNKIGVCQNYANLYEYMCKKAGLECVTLSGWGKNYPYGIVQSNQTNHAWNAVKVKKGWILLDATWAHEKDEDYIDLYWFDTPPEEFIYSHLPKDSAWQLKETKVSNAQFIAFPFVDPFLFKSKLDFEVPSNGTMYLKDGKFNASLSLSDINYSFSFSILPYQGNEWRRFDDTIEWQELSTTTLIDKKQGIKSFNATIPKKGTWWVSISITQKIKNKYLNEITFPSTMIFKVVY